ncbi:MAG: hypothetical protein ACRDBO_16585 [Lachnospiraceae bacterium]
MKIIKFIVVILLLLVIKDYSNVQSSDRNQDAHTNQDPHPNKSHLVDEKYATPDNPVLSPSGKYRMEIESGYNGNIYYNSFAIYEAASQGAPLFVSGAQYRTRDTLHFMWDENDNIRVYSGDVGMTDWVKDGNKWVYQDGWTKGD